RLRAGHTDGRAPLTTAMGVSSRVHRRTTDRGTPAEPAPPASLAELDVAMLGVADLANRRPALLTDVAHLTARQAEGGVIAFLRQKLGRRTRRANHLAAPAGVQLDVVHHGTDRDVAQRKRVAGTDLGTLTAHDGVADPQVERCDDVALLTVCVEDESNARRTVRVILDARNAPGHAVLITLEVDQAVAPAMTATTMAHADAALVVATSTAMKGLR